jgi:hypothetical protein
VNLASAIYQTGFDEVNFDYIRFPSDGNMKDTWYPFSHQLVESDSKWGRAKVLDEFFNYLTTTLKKKFPDIQLSGDLFGQTALAYDDQSIGQLLDDAILYFDRIEPMTYPSHYNQKVFGLHSADSQPYEVLKETAKRIG